MSGTEEGTRRCVPVPSSVLTSHFKAISIVFIILAGTFNSSRHMQLLPGHIFKRLVILMMMVLICIPCPAKRTVKQLLDIPVTAHHTGSQPVKQAACPAFIRHTAATSPVYVLQQATRKPASGGYPAGSSKQEGLRNTTLHNARPFAGNTPIYIRHRCILI